MAMSIPPATLPSANASVAAPQAARAADGDYKTRSASTSQVKDADGDYKAASLAGSKASTAVQSVLINLVKGG